MKQAIQAATIFAFFFINFQLSGSFDSQDSSMSGFTRRVTFADDAGKLISLEAIYNNTPYIVIPHGAFHEKTCMIAPRSMARLEKQMPVMHDTSTRNQTKKIGILLSIYSSILDSKPVLYPVVIDFNRSERLPSKIKILLKCDETTNALNYEYKSV